MPAPDVWSWSSVAVPVTLFGGLTLSYLAGLWTWGVIRRRTGAWEFSARHTWTALLLWGILLAFYFLRPDTEEGRRWARGFADAGVLLFALALAVGPLARLVKPLAKALAWRRELGIWGTLAAAVHVVLVLDRRHGWISGRWALPDAGAAATGPAVAAGDVVGYVALVYAVLLAALSNDVAQKQLRRGWSWIMSRATTLHVLVLLHAWIFASQVYPAPGLAGRLVLSAAVLLLSLQTLAFAQTVRPRKRRARSTTRPLPADASAGEPAGVPEPQAPARPTSVVARRATGGSTPGEPLEAPPTVLPVPAPSAANKRSPPAPMRSASRASAAVAAFAVAGVVRSTAVVEAPGVRVSETRL